MGRRTDIVSIGLSLSLALALFVHVLPTERPSAPKPQTVTPPTPLLKAVRISVATLDLPPPPQLADDAVDDVVGIGVAYARVVRVPLEPLR
mgnify:CR=1 FL=1